jgi:hypothetical protein
MPIAQVAPLQERLVVTVIATSSAGVLNGLPITEAARLAAASALL